MNNEDISIPKLKALTKKIMDQHFSDFPTFVKKTEFRQYIMIKINKLIEQAFHKNEMNIDVTYTVGPVVVSELLDINNIKLSKHNIYCIKHFYSKEVLSNIKYNVI
jgi:predicted XRE-type DNA-binding protein